MTFSSRRLAKPEKPRPLKLSTIGGEQSMEMVLAEMDFVSHCLSSNSVDRPIYSSIVSLCENLKIFGPQLEKIYKDQLDRCYISLRNGCRDEKQSMLTRFRLLEVIELRATQWMPNENLVGYYKKKFSQNELEQTNETNQDPYSPNMNTIRTNQMSPLSNNMTTLVMSPNHTSMSAYSNLVQHKAVTIPTLSPGEIIKSSGKFAKPARIPGKNLCKDEVVIRNVDSGKVMGLKGRRVHMIEELSETVISFQRVSPGVRERLVQITGPTEENLRQAKQLIEDTIRRNASPIPRDDHNNSLSDMEGSSMSFNTSEDSHQNNPFMTSRNSPLQKSLSLINCEESNVEYRYTVAHGNESIRITGTNLAFVKTAKLVLEEFFRNEGDFYNEPLITSDLDESIALSPPSTSARSISPTTEPYNSFVDPQSFNHSPSPTTCRTKDDLAISPKNQTLTIIRKSLIPMSSKTDIEIAEKGDIYSIQEAKTRRALFAKTSEDRKNGQSNDGSCSPDTYNRPLSRITYTRQFLAQCANNELSRRTPKNWSIVVRTFPIIIKQSCLHLASLIVAMNDAGDNSVNETESYLQDCDLYGTNDFIENINRDWTFLRKTSLNEEDNGN